MTIRLLPILCTLLLACSLSAQQTTPAPCGTVGRSPWLDAYQAGRIPHAHHAPHKSGRIRYVPLRLTIVGDDDGAGYADPLTVLQSFQTLNEDFRKLDIQFYFDAPVAYLNNTAYFDHDEFETGRDLIRNYNFPNVVNNYIVENPAGACGYYSGGVDGIALGVNCINPTDRTWSHELGHFFGLPHTFFGWESVGEIDSVKAFDRPAPDSVVFSSGFEVRVERVDGSNCAEAADGFCDTPPDYLPQRWRCTDAGYYPDSLLDPDSVRFAVPARNIMSYAFDGCIEDFSSEQIQAMTANLTIARLGLENLAPDTTFRAARAEDIELLFPENNTEVAYSDSMNLIWNWVPKADFYLVQLNTSTNFNGAVYTSFFTADTNVVIRDILQPRRIYYWRVRPVNAYDVSGGFTDIIRFRNGSVLTGTFDPVLDAGVTLAPNPVGGGQEVTLTGTYIGSGRLTYELLDASGRQLRRQSLMVGTAGFRERIVTEGLLPGIYFLRINLDGRLLTRRLVII